MTKSAINERLKPITLTDNDTGEKYTLEFSRDSVKFAEARGFSLNDVQERPLTGLEDLFFYSFRMHHRNISRQKTDQMLAEKMGGLPDGFVERLASLYAEPFDVFVRIEDGGEAKNSTMTIEM